MPDFKKLSDNKHEVWLSLEGDGERERFIEWAAGSGLHWLNGENVKKTDTCAFHVSVTPDGTVANVPMFAFVHSDNRNDAELVHGFDSFIR